MWRRSYEYLLEAGTQQVAEARVVVGDQVSAEPMLHDPAVIEYQDFVGALDGGQTVGDDDARAVLQELVHGALDKLLRRRVEARRGFVQNYQAGIFQEDAGEGEQ